MTAQPLTQTQTPDPYKLIETIFQALKKFCEQGYTSICVNDEEYYEPYIDEEEVNKLEEQALRVVGIDDAILATVVVGIDEKGRKYVCIMREG